MCGICGVVNYEYKKPVSKDLLKKMCDVMAHRGPNDEGYYTDKYIGLGHRRLSILDLSGGHQPMHNEDKTVWVVFNGEIYNYKELRHKLEQKGHQFYTHCDTEVIVHAYESYGTDCVKHFKGMFAFGLWDTKTQDFFLARDRIGIKPLYYYQKNGKIIFASEIKAILEDDVVERSIHNASLDHFITFGYTNSSSTMFNDIHKLPPGHWMTIKGNDIQIEQFWDLSFDNDQYYSDSYYEERLDTLLEDSVQKRLQSDVPFGVFLSGGLDSSVLVAEMSHLGVDPLQTFSVGFDRKGYSELNYAKMVADYYKTDHHEITVTAQMYRDFFPQYIWHQDEPMTDPATIALYYVSKLASETVTVVLTGEGSDELFAGYERYLGEKIAGWFSKFPPFIRQKLIPGILSKLHKVEKIEKVRQCLVYPTMEDRFLSLRSIYSKETKDLLYQDPLKSALNIENHVKDFAQFLNDLDIPDSLHKTQYVDTKLWLPEDLLMKKDKMGMAASIEARVPFLDHELAEFAATIPTHLKINKLQGKYLLRKVIQDKLPNRIVQRKKMGFPVPLDAWFRDEFKEPITETLTSQYIRERGFFQMNYVEKLLEEHMKNERNHGFMLYQLLCFEMWCRIFLDKAQPTF